MVTIYTTNSCASCRKAKRWLQEYNINFREINITNTPITKDDIVKILENTENGFEDIISTRSKVIMNSNIDIDSMKFNELVDFIIDNPSVLKRPILIDTKKIQVGYNDEDIRVFIPREIRARFACQECGDCEYKQKLADHMDAIKKCAPKISGSQ